MPNLLSKITKDGTLELEGPEITSIEELRGAKECTTLILNNTRVTDLSPIEGLAFLVALEINDAPISFLPRLEALSELQHLGLQDTRISDVSEVSKVPELRFLSLTGSPVDDISAISDTQKLSDLIITRSLVSDLRPILNCPSLLGTPTPDNPMIIEFRDTPACRDPAIAAAASIRNKDDRREALLTHLRTLPRWPEPLSHFLPPQPEDPEAIVPSEQDADLPLVWGEHGFSFQVADVTRDPVVDACLDELRPLLDTLVRKGNQHDDLRALALKAQALLNDDPPNALKLHLTYQALDRLRSGAASREERFDDETLGALSSLRDIVPGITADHPAVRTLWPDRRWTAGHLPIR